MIPKVKEWIFLKFLVQPDQRTKVLNFRKDRNHILDTKKKKKSRIVKSPIFSDFGFLVGVTPKVMSRCP